MADFENIKATMSNDDSSSASSSDHAMPSRGVIPSRKNRGWDGEHMVLAHAQRSAEESKKGPAAVDLSQFRNEEVGKGYQAKFVVRQRTAEDDDQAPRMAVKDMTKPNEAEKKKSSRKKEKLKRSSRDDGDEDDKKSKKESVGTNRLEKYLKSEGMRLFRKELEKFFE